MKEVKMKTPFNHYYYLCTIQREFMNDLKLKLENNKENIKNKENFLKFIDENLPKNLRNTGSISYYAESLKYFVNDSYTLRVNRPFKKILNIERDITSVMRLSSACGHAFHFDYLQPFLSFFQAVKDKDTGEEIFESFQLYSAFVGITKTIKGFTLSFAAPLYKSNVIIGSHISEYDLNKNFDINEEMPEHFIILLNTLLTLLNDEEYENLKELKFEEPSEEKNLMYYRDTCENKIVPAKTKLLD